LYKTYNTYSLAAFNLGAPDYQNNPVYARSLISEDPKVNFQGTVDDASTTPIHTLQVAAIKLNNANDPAINFSGSVGAKNALYSINALTQSQVNAVAPPTFSGQLTFNPDITIKSNMSMNFGSNAIVQNADHFQVIDPAATINFIVPPQNFSNGATADIKSNYVSLNGAGIKTFFGNPIAAALNGLNQGVVPVPPGPQAPIPSPQATVAYANVNHQIVANVARALLPQFSPKPAQTLQAKVNVGQIETDSGAIAPNGAKPPSSGVGSDQPAPAEAQAPTPAGPAAKDVQATGEIDSSQGSSESSQDLSSRGSDDSSNEKKKKK
jgi:hypothetical protein